MKAVLQRVSRASVSIGGAVHASIGPGLLIFLGVSRTDSAAEAKYLAERCSKLRIFPDDAGKMNRSVIDCGGSALVISQFTLFADTSRGHRPGFTDAAPPEQAESLYEIFIAAMKEYVGDAGVASGVFRAMMEISLVNDGPVTILMDTAGDRKPGIV